MARTPPASPGDGDEFRDLASQELAALEELAALKARLARLRERQNLPKLLQWRSHARPEQLPPEGNWRTWYVRGGRGCVAPWTRVWLPMEGRYERIDRLAEAGKPITVLALAPDGPRLASTDGAPFLKGKDDLYVVTTRNGLTIHVTDRHRFLAPDGWCSLAELGEGDKIAAGAPANVKYEPVVSIEPSGIYEFYDMTVPGPENYAAEGFWNHNSGKTWTASHAFAEWILTDPEPGEWGICAPTYQDAWSVCMEGESGLLAAFGTTYPEVRAGEAELVEHWHRSFAEMRLRSGHIVRVASAEDGALHIQGKNLKGCWCVAAGEMVTTARGPVPVERVRAGDMVATRQGWRRVTARTLTRRSANVVKLTADDGRTVRLTADHPVWTANRGWSMAASLTPCDTITLWNPTLTNSSSDRPPTSSGTATSGITTTAPAITATAPRAASTSPSGSTSISGGGPTAMTSTTTTTTRQTTTRRTSSSSRTASTSLTTTRKMAAASPAGTPNGAAKRQSGHGRARPASSPARSAGRPATAQGRPPSTAQTSAGQPPSSPARRTWPGSTRTLQPTRLTLSGATRAPVNASALSAGSLTGPWLLGPSTARRTAALRRWQRGAGLSPAKTAAINTRPLIVGASSVPSAARSTPPKPSAKHGAARSPRIASASTAASRTRPGSRTTRSTAPSAAGIRPGWRAGSLTRCPEPDGTADVYDLTVEDAHEFFAGGILVHNCDEIGLYDRWETVWNESIRYAVRKGTARIIATGTPKKSRAARKLVRLLLDDPDIPVSRLRTADNEANLSPQFYAEVVGKSKGTRLERQELEGDLLADVEGALWTPEVIDASRVTRAPDLVRVVIAIDPAVTGKAGSDESGIIVAGDGGDGHGYVIADYSMRGTPDACMKKAVWAYKEHKADRIVGEANNGGDYLESLLRTVDTDVPYKKVIATRGKAIRAEPVSALYEQKRIHHVGVFSDLEDQLCTWLPTDAESPDRLDALTWAFTELRGLSAGSWHEAYGTVKCQNEKCGRGFMKNNPDGTERTHCPHCRTPVESKENGESVNLEVV